MARLGRSWFGAFVLLVSGCSADHAPTPEPRFDTPGAFVALVDDTGQMALLRSLVLVPIQREDELLFAILYAPQPTSFEHARELAQRESLPISQTKYTIWSEALAELEHEVVWFRTLTPEEAEYVR
jgi:hypothetical protein